MAKKSSGAPVAPSEKTIRGACETKVWERGRALNKGRSLNGLIRAGDELFARFLGSQNEPYQLHARLQNGAVTEASCSCPFEGDGWCKHLVALLLRYAQAPDDYQVLPPLSDMIGALERDELNRLVETLVRREPNLLATLALTQSARQRSGTKAPSNLRAALRNALSGQGAGEGRAALEMAVNDATKLEAAHDWAGASETWRVMLEEIVLVQPHFEQLAEGEDESEYGDFWYQHSDEIDFGEAWSDQAVAGLERCLDVKTLAPGLRASLLQTLWQAWLDSENSSYFVLSEEAINRVLEEAAPPLWKEVEAALLERVEKGRSNREHILDLLCYGWEKRDQRARANAMLRQYGSYRQQLGLLMEAGDWAAAERLALQNESSHEPSLLAVAGDLERAEQHERALKLALRAQELATAYQMPTATEWLARFYLRHENAADAQIQAAQLFVKRPDAASRKLWKQTVGESWDERYPQLENSPAMTLLLRVQLAIADGRAARALELFASLDEKQKRGVEGALAGLCEAEFPARAIELYRQMGEAQIPMRQYQDARAVYRRTAEFWKRARAIHKKQGTMDEWIAYIRAQRETHKRLPALIDELKKAGL